MAQVRDGVNQSGAGTHSVNASACAKHLRLELPETPPANRMWRNWRGRTVLSATAKAYRAQVKACYLRQVGTLCCRYPSGDVRVIVAWHRSARRGDLDGRLKLLLDALNGLAYRDDRQIGELVAERQDDGQGVMVVVVEPRWKAG